MSDYYLPFTTQGCGREADNDYDFTKQERLAELKFRGHDPLNKFIHDQPQGNAGEVDRIAAEAWWKEKGYA